ncbi:MAG: efflux RND transporter periplasmic adaptor subunit [Candidatus Korobacteraceae bacterium]
MANGKGKKGKGPLYSIGILAVLAIIVVVFVAAKGKGTKLDSSRLAKVERGDLTKSVVATGKIEPIAKVELKSKASGIVKKWYADAGDQVKTGTVLVELDKEEILARVRSAKAALQATEANLNGARAELERAKVDAEGPDIPLLKRAYDRALQMANDGVVSQAALDEAKRSYEVALNRQNVARAQLEVQKARVKQAEAQVAQAQANLSQLEEEHRNSTIVAPMDGLVLSRNVEIGDAVSSILVMGSAATLVMTLGDTNQVYLKGKVDETDIGKVYLGQPAQIKVESFKDKTFNGAVTKISPMGEELNNVTTFEVRVSIANATGELKAAMTANAEILLEKRKDTLLIPEGAILYDQDKQASVEVPDASQQSGKKKVAVDLGISNGAKAEVLRGVKQGDEVVLQ